VAEFIFSAVFGHDGGGVASADDDSGALAGGFDGRIE